MLCFEVDKDMQSRNEQTTVELFQMQHSLTPNPNMWYCCQISNLVGQIKFPVWWQHVWNFYGKLPWTTNSVLRPAQVRPLGGRIKEFPLYCAIVMLVSASAEEESENISYGNTRYVVSLKFRGEGAPVVRNCSAPTAAIWYLLFGIMLLLVK